MSGLSAFDVLVLAGAALPLLMLGWNAWQLAMLRRAAKRLGLSVRESKERLELGGRWQGIAVELIRIRLGAGKHTYYEVVARAELPPPELDHGDSEPLLAPITIVDGWIEHRRREPLSASTLASLLDRLAHTARSTRKAPS